MGVDAHPGTERGQVRAGLGDGGEGEAGERERGGEEAAVEGESGGGEAPARGGARERAEEEGVR